MVGHLWQSISSRVDILNFQKYYSKPNHDGLVLKIIMRYAKHKGEVTQKQKLLLIPNTQYHMNSKGKMVGGESQIK